MVSWFVTNTIPEGIVTAFARQVGSGLAPTRALLYADAARLASAGSVDANLITRFQYGIVNNSDIGAQANIRYTAADFAAMPGASLGAYLYLAPATSFLPGTTPTPSQIRDAAVFAVAGRAAAGGGAPAWLDAPGDLTLTFFRDATPIRWDPNRKWWLLVAPAASNGVPVGDINVNGRAVSFWTNRTPAAPKITKPENDIIARPGTALDFEFKPQDPDAISMFPGDLGRADFTDVAGVQVQIRPKPTPGFPNPVWSDMFITPSSGSGFTPGWFIHKALGSVYHTGAKVLWETGKMKIQCGAVNEAVANNGILRSGDWQVRVRTFDYGHPYPNTWGGDASPGAYPPLNDTTLRFEPGNYPESNTSPWSAIREISIPPRVPPPLLLSPNNNAAVVEGKPVTVRWQYRNSYVPPFPQAKVSVYYKRVGAQYPPLLAYSGPYTEFSYDIPANKFVKDRQYEVWISVEDSAGGTQGVGDSEPRTFWVVAEPDSGNIIPEPADSIEGATLGCGTHRIEIYRRGGKARVGEITGVSSLEYSRVRDDISTAKITVKNWGIDCGNLLADLQTWAYEVVIFRDNGYEVDRVWEGPITLLTYENEQVVIHAKDVVAYLYRRILKVAMVDSGKSLTAGRTVVERATDVVQTCFAPDDPNVLEYLHVLSSPGDAKQYRSTPAYGRTGFEEIDDMASNAGLDYTAVGRAILLWGTKHRIGTLPEMRDTDLGSSPIVSEYGMSMANVYAISDGSGLYGEATRLNDEGKDPTYGLVEMLSSTWASETEEESGTYTEAGQTTVKESFAESAERSISDRYPPPVVVRVPDNTPLNSTAVISIQHLVPGVVIPLRSTGTLRTVVADQKLDSVKVTERAGEETISITLSPFSREDTAAEEGE